MRLVRIAAAELGDMEYCPQFGKRLCESNSAYPCTVYRIWELVTLGKKNDTEKLLVYLRKLKERARQRRITL